MIAYGKKEYVPQLKTLWRDIFGDSEEYVDAFFEGVYHPDNVLLFVAKKEVLAALYMVPYKVIHKKYGRSKVPQLYVAQLEESSAVYLYALATKETARNKGIMGKLLQESGKVARMRGDQYQFLIPADEKVVNYYKRFGFQNRCCITNGMFTAKELIEIKKDATAEENERFLIYQKGLEKESALKKITIMVNMMMDYEKITEKENNQAIFIENMLM